MHNTLHANRTHAHDLASKEASETQRTSEQATHLSRPLSLFLLCSHSLALLVCLLLWLLALLLLLLCRHSARRGDSCCVFCFCCGENARALHIARVHAQMLLVFCFSHTCERSSQLLV